MTTLRLEDFTACGAHQEGHFLLSSGLHSGDYMQCALYLAQPRRAETTGSLLAAALERAALVPDIVVGPAMGGLIIGHEVARSLDRPFIFTERVDRRMMLRRGFGLAEGQSVVIIEDVVTTGKSTREVMTVLEGLGGTVIGVASIVNRTGTAAPFDEIPYHSLLEVSFPTWQPEDCPRCAEGTPIAKPGSRPVG
jgi:orotate phosphoribosyltransferase